MTSPWAACTVGFGPAFATSLGCGNVDLHAATTMKGEADREFDTRMARELDARWERERAPFGEGDPAPDERLNDVPLRREVHRFPAPGGRLVIELMPKLGVAPDADWLHNIPAHSRLRLTTRWETRFVHPIPERRHEMSAKWLARMWEGAEPA